MTLTDPQYSKEPVLDGIEHLGHWLHKGEHVVIDDTAEVLRDALIVRKELAAQFPTLATEATNVLADVVGLKLLGAAVAAAVLGGGTNLAADAGVLAALVTDGPALIKMFADSGTMASTLSQDVKTDVQSLE